MLKITQILTLWMIIEENQGMNRENLVQGLKLISSRWNLIINNQILHNKILSIIKLLI